MDMTAIIDGLLIQGFTSRSGCQNYYPSSCCSGEETAQSACKAKPEQDRHWYLEIDSHRVEATDDQFLARLSGIYGHKGLQDRRRRCPEDFSALDPAAITLIANRVAKLFKLCVHIEFSLSSIR